MEIPTCFPWKFVNPQGIRRILRKWLRACCQAATPAARTKSNRHGVRIVQRRIWRHIAHSFSVRCDWLVRNWLPPRGGAQQGQTKEERYANPRNKHDGHAE
jgi:hypothetical protein